ncbi:MAG: hypothetical protein WBC91_13620 [Phototrophicaceae bacterium]
MQYSVKTLPLLIIFSVILAACGNNTAIDDNAVATAINLPTRIATSVVTSIDNSADDANGLSQTVIVDNAMIASRLTVDYPAGWFANQSGEQLLLASIDPDEITPESDVIVINILPVEGDMLDNFSDRTPDGILSQAMLDATGQIVDVAVVTINGQDAAFASPILDDNPSLVYTLQFGEDVFIVLTAIRTQGFSDADIQLIEQIATQLEYNNDVLSQDE